MGEVLLSVGEVLLSVGEVLLSSGAPAELAYIPGHTLIMCLIMDTIWTATGATCWTDC